ncbi:MAG: hypothetical protein NPINA01_19880 [Nitrospinaceae bacterium]|nr:MAG: hypothetical protein NPINA01_19880 [Nitrospinaceae bacterium]
MHTHKSRRQFLLFKFLIVCFFSIYNPVFADSFEKSPGLSPRTAANYIHAVIEADRRIYAHDIVARLSKKGLLSASENWKEENTLLLPAQFLLKSAEISNARGIGMRYYLTSLWPINKTNGPKSENEKIGLQAVVRNPEEPFSWIVQEGRRWVYQTIYPDIATSESCVACHNNHPDSPRKDFKLGDVMGGILINLPLGKQEKHPELGKHQFPPEIISDYVHSILESDREVYSKYIVDRLKNQNIIQPSTNWWNDNGLPLPAQFLLNASQVVEKRKPGVFFRLISRWPINPKNGPANEFEHTGLETVEVHPIRPYIGLTKVGRKRYFRAVYPDFAVTQGCVNCHNADPASPKQDFELNDVMGGIVVTLDVK